MKKLAWVAALLAGCGGGSSDDPVDDFFDGLGTFDDFLESVPPVIVPTPNRLEAFGVTLEYSGEHYVNWWCDAGQANLRIPGPDGGSIRIEIRDGNGTLVHDNKHHPAMNGHLHSVTAPGGEPGLWQVKFTFNDAIWSGTIVIEADLDGLADAIEIPDGWDMDDTLQYEVGWAAGSMTLFLSSGIVAGDLRVHVWDPDGVLVLDRHLDYQLDGPYQEVSLVGPAGTWKVQIEMDDLTLGGGITISQP